MVSTGDVKRAPSATSIHRVHVHTCPECKRPYSCNCSAQPEQEKLICRDCEHGEGPQKAEE